MKTVNIKNICYFIILLLLGGSLNPLKAQQDAQFSQYMFNTLAFNPAYAGSAGLLNVTALYRAQWVGFDGAPQTQTLTANSPLKNKNLAVGGSLFNDVIGPAHTFGLYGDFVYRINFAKSKLAFGVKVGFDIFQGTFTSLDIIDNSDPSFAQNVNGKFQPNAGFGVYYYAKKYYIGFSAPKLIRNTIYDSVNDLPENGKQEINSYFTVGYVFVFSRDVKFKPAVLFKFVQNAPAQLDINLNFLFVDRFWFGVMFRPGAAWGFLAQFQITDQLRFGYSLDLSTHEIQTYNKGTHEFMLSYDFGYNRTKIRSPRYF